MNTRNPVLGFFCVVLGLVIILLSIGSLLIRGLIAFLGFMLVNVGLQLQGSSSLHYRVYNWFTQIRYRR